MKKEFRIEHERWFSTPIDRDCVAQWVITKPFPNYPSNTWIDLAYTKEVSCCMLFTNNTIETNKMNDKLIIDVKFRSRN